MASKRKITSFFMSETEGKNKQLKTRVQWLQKASFQQAWKLILVRLICHDFLESGEVTEVTKIKTQ